MNNKNLAEQVNKLMLGHNTLAQHVGVSFQHLEEVSNRVAMMERALDACMAVVGRDTVLAQVAETLRTEEVEREQQRTSQLAGLIEAKKLEATEKLEGSDAWVVIEKQVDPPTRTTSPFSGLRETISAALVGHQVGDTVEVQDVGTYKILEAYRAATPPAEEDGSREMVPEATQPSESV